MSWSSFDYVNALDNALNMVSNSSSNGNNHGWISTHVDEIKLSEEVISKCVRCRSKVQRKDSHYVEGYGEGNDKDNIYCRRCAIHRGFLTASSASSTPSHHTYYTHQPTIRR
jgi:hypothetical protein